MICDHCGECCKDTEMILLDEDIKRILRLGYNIEQFAVLGDDGFYHLKNVNGHCVFWDSVKKRCKIYHSRPFGCKMYPVIYDMDKSKCIIDKECHLWYTVKENEFKMKCKKIRKALREIGIIS
ncbi:MAG: YkgJ family cysteine cluster protein [Candidatus Asgardarchaeia archaeon]